MVNRYDYDSYGRVVGGVEGVENPFLFTGREWDQESGLYYYRARHYDAFGGRFMGRDPLGLAGGDGNLYLYASNDPVNRVDPLGTISLSRPTESYRYCYRDITGSFKTCFRPLPAYT